MFQHLSGLPGIWQPAICVAFGNHFQLPRRAWNIASSQSLASDADAESVATAGWANPDVDSVAGNARKALLDGGDAILAEFDGPVQYLEHHLKTTEDLNAFEEHLWLTFPELDTIVYHHASLLPPVLDGDLAVTPALPLHLCAFGFQRIHSNKPPPVANSSRISRSGSPQTASAQAHCL